MTRKRQAFDVVLQYRSNARPEVAKFRFGPYSRRGAERAIERLLSASTARGTSLGRIKGMMKGALVAVGASAIVIALASLWPQPAERSWLPVIDQNKLVQVSDVNMQNIRIVAAQAGIVVPNKDGFTGTPTPFYVFTRPNCAECETVDRILEDISPEFVPVVLPAGFESDPSARRAIAQAYCSSNPGRTWVEIAKGVKLADKGDPDCNWQEQAKVTSLMAKLLALASAPQDWPLVVAPNGKATRGSYPSEGAAKALTDHLRLNAR